MAKVPVHHLPPGTVLNGRYYIGEAIGEGGFGITYIGLDINLDMKIAVKEFYPHGYANRNNTVSNDVTLIYLQETAYFDKAKDHFLNEAKSIGKFSKEDSIVDVRDYFTENGTAYIVMEFIEGETLTQRIKRLGVFSADDIFERMIPLMKALNRMHRQDVIHRDISPENIMITDEGKLKLMDFGSARYFAGDNKRTMSVILKPGYAPFEQYSSQGDQGPWTDVYGICATIYKCITGITPPDAMSRCQKESLKPPSSLGFHLSEQQESALMQGLCVYPEDRIPNIDVLMDVLFRSASPYVRPIAPIPPVPDPEDMPHGSSVTYGDPYSRYVPPEKASQERRKSYAVPVAIISVITVLIAIGVVAFLYFKFWSNNDPIVEPKTPTQAETVQPTVEETVAPTEPEETTDNTIHMPNVVGDKYTDAKAKLEGLGMIVEITREKSETVAKDYVIRQSVDEGRELQSGNSVMLYVSDGQPPEPTSAPAPTSPPAEKTYDVEAEVTNIRTQVRATFNDPGTEVDSNDCYFFVKNDKITMIQCPYGAYGWKDAREYYFKNDKLYFAYVKEKDGGKEHRLYFVDNNVLIRYMDPKDVKWNYGNINCPVESDVLNDAYLLLNDM